MRNLLLLIISLFCVKAFSQDLANVYQAETFAWDYFPDKLANQNPFNTFIFNPQAHLWAVYNKEGELVGAGRASGGKDYCADIQGECRTIQGEFTIQRKGDQECKSNTFPIETNGGAPMPYCMFFYQGYAIHGSNSIPSKNASHGCIRVNPKAAEWMNQYYLDIGDRVVVLPYEDATAQSETRA